jgi:molybdopterin-biosynthesis enzyme MoeA-like protein
VPAPTGVVRLDRGDITPTTDDITAETIVEALRAPCRYDRFPRTAESDHAKHDVEFTEAAGAWP